jgi:hypothetical protein
MGSPTVETGMVYFSPFLLEGGVTFDLVSDAGLRVRATGIVVHVFLLSWLLLVVTLRGG